MCGLDRVICSLIVWAVEYSVYVLISGCGLDRVICSLIVWAIGYSVYVLIRGCGYMYVILINCGCGLC